MTSWKCWMTSINLKDAFLNSPLFWSVTKPTGFYISALSISQMNKTARNPYQRLFRQFTEFGINKGRISQEYGLVSKENIKNRLPNEPSKFINSTYLKPSQVSKSDDKQKAENNPSTGSFILKAQVMTVILSKFGIIQPKWKISTINGYRYTILNSMTDANYITEDVTFKQCFDQSKRRARWINYRKEYKKRISTTQRIVKHLIDGNINIGYLIRDLLNQNVKIGSQRINKHTNVFINLIKWDKGKNKPKPRALGSALAKKAGATCDGVVSQEFWLSLEIFEMCYQLSRR
ncbi:hypothetical protein BB560_003261 [Smittium megazygosporum]|uniref:Uncharacterized protein n=1 Tax=Smittium megazygosporum TaxID=133381 RepID=A0A2T9ZCL6_9FUNG|nr:hypothetical protein BB560_003261 [Smittium megazygosporum]